LYFLLDFDIITDKFGYITEKIGYKMIEVILGSENAEKVLMFLFTRQKGNATEIAKFFKVDQSTVQNQLAKFANGSVLISFLEGKTRVYEFNPRYAFFTELKALLEKALQFYSPDEIERLKMNRRRPIVRQ
jgi:predicted transcriptional regulator